MAIDRICSLTKQRPPLRNRGLLSGDGTVVPVDGTDGWQTGAIFQKTDGGGGTALYVNEGSVTDSDFNAIDAGAIDVSLDVGVFASLLPGDGIAISSTDTSAVAIYGDDAGLSIASNVYNLRTRLLLTTDQDGASIRALMAQLKLATGVNVSTGVYTASQGYVELAGTHSCETGAQFSCFDASLEIGTVLTVDAGGKMAGIYIETTGTGTITNNGICSAIIITKATGAASWPSGITIDGSTVQHGILVGSTTDGEGVVLSATVTKAVGIYAELATDAGSGYNVRPLRARLRVDTGGTVETETYGIQGQHNVYTSNLGHWHAGILGSIEQSNGTVRVYNPLAGAAGVIGRVDGAITVDTAGWLASFVALSNATVTLTSGQHMGLYVTKTAGQTSFSRGIYIDGSAVDYGIMVGEHSNTVGDGVTVSDTTKRIAGFFADDNAVGTGGAEFISVLRGRLLMTGAAYLGEQYGLHGTVIYRPAASASISSWTAGVLGTLEGATGMSVGGIAGAILARVGFGAMQPTVTGRVAGVYSLNNMAAELGSGSTSAFLTYTVGTVKWTNGLEIFADSCVTGINIGTCTDGIIFTGTVTEKCIDFGQVTLSGDSCCNIWSYGDGDGAVTVVINDYWFATRMNVESTTDPVVGERLAALMFNKFTVSSADQPNLDLQGIGLTLDIGKNVGYAHGLDIGVDISGNCTPATGTVIAGKFTLDISSSMTLTTAEGDDPSAVLGLVTGTGTHAGSGEISCFEARKEGASTITNGIYLNVAPGATITHGIHFGGTGTFTYAMKFDKNAAPAEAHVADENSTGRIKILVDSDVRYLYYYD